MKKVTTNKSNKEVEYEVVDEFTIDNCHYIIKQPTHELTEEELTNLGKVLVKAIYGI